jgi:hypothetical protein
MIAGRERCDACAGTVYGGQERHEPLRLFSPGASADARAAHALRRHGRGAPMNWLLASA